MNKYDDKRLISYKNLLKPVMNLKNITLILIITRILMKKILAYFALHQERLLTQTSYDKS